MNGGYRVHLFEMAVADGKDITFVGSLSNGPQMVADRPFPGFHQGHPGWVIRDLKDIIPRPALAFEPHIILLEIGLTDLLTVERFDAAAFLTDVVNLITTHSPQSLLVIATVSELAFQEQIPAGRYNSAIRGLASRNERIVVADIDSKLIFSPFLPRESDFRIMAEVWYEAIKPYLR